jgi:DNA primase
MANTPGQVRVPPRPGADRLVDTEAIRHEHPIVDLVASYGIELRRAGSAMVGRCPFHRDGGRPNLHVYERSGRFVCYRCDARGDAIAFVQQMEQLTFREAVERLGGTRAAAQGAPAAIRPIRYRPVLSRRRGVVWGSDEYRVAAAATELYANRLLEDAAALDYMVGRGFPRSLLERSRVGYCAGDQLLKYLGWRKLPVGAALRAGLLTDDGREFLAGRIVFPEIRAGRVIWLIGRILEGGSADPATADPRYLGLPGRKPLLGWEAANRDLRGVCVVEGPTDLLALRAWGVPGLALCGAALTDVVLRLLGRWARLYLVLDDDDTGRKATARLQAAFGPRAIPVRLPPGIKDPAVLAPRPDGETLFSAAICTAFGRHLATPSEVASEAPQRCAVGA